MGSGKSAQIKRSGIVMAGVMFLAGISGCGNAAAEIPAVKEEMRSEGHDFWYEGVRDLEGAENIGDIESIEGAGDIGNSENMEDAADEKETEKIAELCRKLYKTAEQKNDPDHIETVSRLINGLGEAGYAAVDSENQVDMAEYAQAVRFCEKAEAKKEAELRIAVTDYPSGFVIYHLQTKDGKITVNKSGYVYKNGTAEKTAAGSYEAEYWEYTKEGYLIFSGSWFSEEMYVLVLEDMKEHTALRIQPLEAACRELNRKYILPAGYEKNNLFLTDWSEEDFGELDFYDAFDCCYEMMCGQPVPYTADGDLNAGTAYRIPAEIFEGIIRKYFDINARTLRESTVYFPEDMTYEYMPRGFYEGGYCEIPYPEVEAYTENGDGTVTLFVNAVYPKENTSGAYRHKTVIRPLDDGSFQYVSNQMIYEGEEYDAWWNTKRLSGEEREILYDKGNSEAEG